MKNSKMFMMVGMMVVLVMTLVVGGGVMMQGKLQAKDSVTRAELMEMLAPVLAGKLGDQLKDYTCNPFSDVSLQNTTPRQMKSICYMFKKGFISKQDADNLFTPGNFINRAEAAKLFWGVFSTSGGDVGKMAINPAYTDINVSDWYYNSVQNVASAGILEIAPWQGNKFEPLLNLTKSRAKVWIKNLNQVLTSPF